MTKKEFQNKYSPKYDEITINGVTISFDCYEINVEDGKDVVCFYNEGGYCFMCSIPLEDVDLINRQQAEIEKLNVELVGMRGACNSYKMHYDNAKAEIERLQEDSKRLKKVQMQLDDAMKMYSTIKAEVIKEYKEKLREHAYLDSGITGFQEMVVDLSDIENIADEMVGEGK